MPVLSPSRFKAMARKGLVVSDATLRKEMIAPIMAIGDRVLRFVISTATPDRENDTIDQAGWDLTAYRLNPIVLWGHDSHSHPIGRAFDLEIEDGALKASVEFVPADDPYNGGLAESTLRKLKTGFLSATSVGFRPLDYDIANDRDDGEGWMPPMDFKRQELLEFSIVCVPCNPEALIEAPADLLATSQGVDPNDALRAAAEAEEKAQQETADLEAFVERNRIARERRRRTVDFAGLT